MGNTKNLAGYIKHNGTQYVFVSRWGQEYNVIQDSKAMALAESGKICIFELLPSKNPEEKLGRVIHEIDNNGMQSEIKIIEKQYGLNNDIPYELKKELSKIPSRFEVKDYPVYTDMTNIPFLTIDPDNAGDYDDAVYAYNNGDGSYTLMVAIANVAGFASPNSNLFNYAVDRGNSFYIGEKVYSMTPSKIANETCSLVEGENRLTLCTTCVIQPDGKLTSFKVQPAVIKSRHRLTYKEADYIHFGKNSEGDYDNHSGLISKTIDVKDSLACLYDVSQILFNARMKRHSFDIDEREYSFILSPDKKKVVDYKLSHNEEFTKVIEESAIITNEIWGEIAIILGIPFSYRNHEIMNDDQTHHELSCKLKPFNLSIPKKFGGGNIQSIINKVKGKRIYEYVVRLLLSSTKPAQYSTQNCGHAGLGVVKKSNTTPKSLQIDLIDNARARFFKSNGSIYGLEFEGDISHSAYAHTTSDIRRGSDLVNMTQMLSVITNGQEVFDEHQIDLMNENFNAQEKMAKMAEGDYIEMSFASWASNNIGKQFSNCVVVDMSNKHATVMTQDGLKFIMQYKPRDYLKIGKEIASVTIDKVSINPPRIVVVQTPTNSNVRYQDSEGLTK